MRRLTYSPGRYSQVQLDDASHVFVRIAPSGIRVSRLFLGLIPTATLWQAEIPLQLRGLFATSGLAQRLLDQILESIELCRNVGELGVQLERHAAPLVRDLIRGLHPAVAETDDAQVIRAFGALLERLKADGRPLQPISKLPDPKDTIRQALTSAIRRSKDQLEGEALKSTLAFLDEFVPDGQVPADPTANAVAWAERRSRRS